MTKEANGEGIRSMTGFGRAAFELDGVAFDVEVRSVNHRHVDVRLKLPRILAHCEAAVRTLIPKRLRRGKVDLTISAASGDALDAVLEVDEGVVEQYVKASRDLGERFGLTGTLDVTTLLTMPGVARFVDPGVDTERSEAALVEAVEHALEALDAMRAAEGASLAEEFAMRLGHIDDLVRSLESRSGSVREAARERLHKRARQLELDTGVLDEGRLHQEIVMAADRLDITEELTRLRSHVEQFHAVLEGAGREHPVGRRLDFLLQELGREANTIGSKANDATLAHDVVELKTELERIREQVQNIE